MQMQDDARTLGTNEEEEMRQEQRNEWRKLREETEAAEVVEENTYQSTTGVEIVVLGRPRRTVEEAGSLET